jgi:hypothetical protein
MTDEITARTPSRTSTRPVTGLTFPVDAGTIVK